MKAIKHYASTALLATLLVLSAPSMAGPITLNIPVNLSNMHPDVFGFNVFCRIKDEAGRDYESARSTSLVRLSGGSYNGTVVVTGGADPSVVARAVSYRCFLSFSVTGAPAVHTPAPVPGERYSETAYIEERLTHDTTAPFRHYIEGRF